MLAEAPVAAYKASWRGFFQGRNWSTFLNQFFHILLAPRHHDAGRQAGTHRPAALPLPISCFRRPFQKRAHLDRRPTADHSLAPPCKCIIQIGGFQHPKLALYVLIGLQIRGPSAMSTLPLGCARGDLRSWRGRSRPRKS